MECCSKYNHLQLIESKPKWLLLQKSQYIIDAEVLSFMRLEKFLSKLFYNYYNSKYQGIPKNGYTSLIQNILDHKNIKVRLNTTYNKHEKSNYKHVFYTGPIDSYLDCKHGKLGYRTVYFEKEIYTEDYQGNAVVNYCNKDVPYTRIHEHKHFAPWETHNKTIVVKEFSKETLKNDEPYYPKRLVGDMVVLEKYKDELRELKDNVSFVGRLATYRYMDMDKVIKEALEYSDYFLDNYKNKNIDKIFSDDNL